MLAGLLSFLSPCVLPLIPSYLCVIGGSPPSSDGGRLQPRLVALTLSFVLGFSAVFITLSIISAATFNLMGNATRWIGWVSGAVVIVLGLNIVFNFIPFLSYEKRPRFAGRGIAGTFVTGAAFGAGWTPCVGPVLAGVLLLAAQGGVPRAAVFLACYSAGLALPFLLASLFFNAFLKASEKIRPYLPAIQKISGVLLVVLGALIASGQYQRFSALAAQWQPNPAASGRADSVQAIPAGGKIDGAVGGRDNAIPPETMQLFTSAGLSVAAEGIDPIDFTLPLLDGTTQTLSALKGSVVFLNFWATWCPPCREEMPSMESLYRRLRDRGMVMLAVNGGETPEQVSGFMRENALTFPTVMDRTGSVSRQYGIQAIPTTYIIDRRGLIVARMIGAIRWDTPEVIAALESLLE